MDPHQTKQAEVQRQAADDTVTARLPEAYQWLLTPEQATPQAPLEWKAIRLTGAGGLVERAAKRLRNVAASGRKKLRRFHGSVRLDPTRAGRDAGRIAEEVIVHLAVLDNAEVTVTLDIAANLPDGTPENVLRTVNENSRTLKFSNHAFEEA